MQHTLSNEEIQDLLDDDLQRINSLVLEGFDFLDEAGMRIVMRTMSKGDVEAYVEPTETLTNAVKRVLDVPHHRRVAVWFGGDRMDVSLSFEENGIEEDATLTVKDFERATLQELKTAMLDANPQLNVDQVRRVQGGGVSVHPDGTVRNWNLTSCGLQRLPDLIGDLEATGSVLFNNNNLTSLPDSIGGLVVGRDLDLRNNAIKELPESIGNLIVERDLNLGQNKLATLPASFGSAFVGRHLKLNSNKLESLPESFCNLTVGGDICLWGNETLLDGLPRNFSVLERADREVQLDEAVDGAGGVSAQVVSGGGADQCVLS